MPLTAAVDRSSAPVYRLGRSHVWLALGVYVFCLLARLVFVSLYSHELPFWDQWDAEADRLLKPFQESSLTLKLLFDPHNEHRIFFSRILSLALFELNDGQWNNLVEAYAACAVFATVPAGFVYFANRHDTPLAPKVASGVVACALTLFPYDFENALVGFQSQFYFMAGFAILLCATAAFAKPDKRTTSLLVVLGACSLFTMASGLLAPVPAIAVLWLRHGHARERRSFLIASSVALICVILLGIALFPRLGGDLAAQGFVEHVQALSTNFMWPLQPRGTRPWNETRKIFYALCVWAPALTWSLVRILSRRAGRTELFVAGLAGWVALQLLAIAHSRGHGMAMMSSRYTDIAAIGLLCNTWLAARLFYLPLRHRWAFAIPTVLFALAASSGLVSRTPSDLGSAYSWKRFGDIQTANVAGYLRTRDPSWLQQPTFEIPYPDARRLQELLDNRTIGGMLPPSVYPPEITSGVATPSAGSSEFLMPRPRMGTLTLRAQQLQRFVRSYRATGS